MLDGNYPELTHTLPLGPASQLYTYYGKTLLGEKNLPLYMRDDLRSKPTLVCGTTGSGKTEGMLARAYQDASKGRPVIFIDGKGDRSTWERLFYYCAYLHKRPFLGLFPTEQLDHLSNSWNPLISGKLSSATVVDSFFSSYMRDRKNEGEAAYYNGFTQNAFTQLTRALHNSGYNFNIQDISVSLEDGDFFNEMERFIQPQGREYYDMLAGIRNKDIREYNRVMTSFWNYLKVFDHWTLNSTNPEIRLEDLYYSNAILYVYLPVGQQRWLMTALGNIILNQLRSLSNYVQSTETSARRRVPVFGDEVSPFIDQLLAEWVSKTRSSGLMLELGVQGLEDLATKSANIGESIRNNVPNVLMYNPHSVKTASWLSELFDMEGKLVHTRNLDGDEETDAGVERFGEGRKIPPGLVNNLRLGQFLFCPVARVFKPAYLASPLLPEIPPGQRYRWQGGHNGAKPEVRGFNLQLRAHKTQPRPVPIEGLLSVDQARAKYAAKLEGVTV